MDEFDMLVSMIIGFIIGRKAPPIANWHLPQELKDALRAKLGYPASKSSSRPFKSFWASPKVTRDEHVLQQLTRFTSGRYHWICTCMDAEGITDSGDRAYAEFIEHCRIVHSL